MKNNTEQPVKKSISELAHISTLSEDEIDDLPTEGYDDEYETDDEAGEDDAEEKSSVADYMPYNSVPEEKPAEKRIEHTEPSFVIAAKPDRKCVYDFMFYHSYMNPMGIISILLGIAAIFFTVYGIIVGYSVVQIVLFAVIAAMAVANSPLTLWPKAKKQSDMICDEKNTITYTFSDEGFDMSRGTDEYAPYTWDRMYKVKEGGAGFYMYIERNRAFVIPKADLSDAEGFRELLRRHVEKRLLLAGGKK